MIHAHTIFPSRKLLDVSAPTLLTSLYRDTEGSTITMIAAELGVSEATPSAWCKAAGVSIRHCRSASAAAASPGSETADAGTGPAAG